MTEKERAEALKMRVESREKLASMRREESKVYIEKIKLLNDLLKSESIEESESGIGGFLEQKYKLTFDESERSSIKNKLFDLIFKL